MHIIFLGIVCKFCFFFKQINSLLKQMKWIERCATFSETNSSNKHFKRSERGQRLRKIWSNLERNWQWISNEFEVNLQIPKETRNFITAANLPPFKTSVKKWVIKYYWRHLPTLRKFYLQVKNFNKIIWKKVKLQQKRLFIAVLQYSCFWNTCETHRRTPVLESLFNKAAGLQPVILLKRYSSIGDFL